MSKKWQKPYTVRSGTHLQSLLEGPGSEPECYKLLADIGASPPQHAVGGSQFLFLLFWVGGGLILQSARRAKSFSFRLKVIVPIGKRGRGRERHLAAISLWNLATLCPALCYIGVPVVFFTCSSILVSSILSPCMLCLSSPRRYLLTLSLQMPISKIVKNIWALAGDLVYIK